MIYNIKIQTRIKIILTFGIGSYSSVETLKIVPKAGVIAFNSVSLILHLVMLLGWYELSIGFPRVMFCSKNPTIQCSIELGGVEIQIFLQCLKKTTRIIGSLYKLWNVAIVDRKTYDKVIAIVYKFPSLRLDKDCYIILTHHQTFQLPKTLKYQTCKQHFILKSIFEYQYM